MGNERDGPGGEYEWCHVCRQRYSVSIRRRPAVPYICQDCRERDAARLGHRRPNLIYRDGLARVVSGEAKEERACRK